MTGPKGNSEFCFLETLNGSNNKVVGKQNSLCKCFVIPPNLKLEKNCEEIVCSTPAGS